MEEIEIAIDILKVEKQDIEIKVCDFSRYGRSPSDQDYQTMIDLLQTWSHINSRISALQSVLKAVKSNRK